MVEVSHFSVAVGFWTSVQTAMESVPLSSGPKQDLIMGTTSHTLPRSGTDSVVRY